MRFVRTYERVWRGGILSAALGAALAVSTPAWADSLAGKGTSPGDITITNNGASTSFGLVCGGGGTVTYGTFGTGQSRYVTKGAVESCNGQAIWVQAARRTVCKDLTDYRTDYAPIVFEVNPDTGTCALDKSDAGQAGTTPTPEPTPVPAPTPGGDAASGGNRVLGGWVGDEGWDTPLPSFMGRLDYLNLGYITCIETLRNGTCDSPGRRNAYDGPPAALTGAASKISYVLGGDGCNTAGWNNGNIVKAANTGWDGVDIDNECGMTIEQINGAIGSVQQAGKSTVVTYLTDVSKAWLGQVNPKPDYYAAMAFWGSEFCSTTDPAPGCAGGPDGGYENFLPVMLKDTLAAVGADNSRKVILGLHPKGSNSATVSYWCKMVKDYNLGGVFVTFIESMPEDLYNDLRQCLN